jgi:hypothetical protein
VIRRVAILLLAVGFAGGCGSEPTAPSRGETPPKPRYRLAIDHDVYPSSTALRDAADAIAIGTPTARTVRPGQSPGNDAAGDPIPGVPHTEHTVQITERIKGDFGGTIVVAVPGGATPQGDFSAEGMLQPPLGRPALFFLKDGNNGRFYPLAAGTAIGAQQPDGTFAIPAATTGAGPLALTAAQARGRGPVATANGTSAVPPSGSPSGSSPSQRASATGPLVRVTLVRGQRRTTALRRGLRLRVTCSPACRLTARLTAASATARRLKLTRTRRKVVVARGTSARAGTVRLRFTSAGRRRLRGRRAVSLELRVDATGTNRGVTRIRRNLRLAGRRIALR